MLKGLWSVHNCPLHCTLFSTVKKFGMPTVLGSGREEVVNCKDKVLLVNELLLASLVVQQLMWLAHDKEYKWRHTNEQKSATAVYTVAYRYNSLIGFWPLWWSCNGCHSPCSMCYCIWLQPLAIQFFSVDLMFLDFPFQNPMMKVEPMWMLPKCGGRTENSLTK